MPKAVLYSELCQRKLNRSGPIKHFKDQLKEQLTAARIDTKTWELRATDKNSWCSTARKAALMFNNTRHQTAEEKRGQRKGTVPAQPRTQQRERGLLASDPRFQWKICEGSQSIPGLDHLEAAQPSRWLTVLRNPSRTSWLI
ncbi:hypothetical protein AAFF_G00397440 [Aldrovandia affinis]|uniref:Uncharacterized protein n=1 Tax=Aldrovandia affinis TaxID=143900 RepID=A0AAD7WKH2_9TELE|nr:hypothetical protein AAFF_G00397440 [Aldrovandia affinis]